jgi:outer membrane protein OmpA-like peptidoglycan-associated protein
VYLTFKETMLILTFCWIYFLGLLNNAPSQKAVSYVYMEGGTYWDAATGIDLKSTVYARVDGKKIKLGESNDKGILNLRVPTNAQSLIFESDGYVSTEKPVHFIGSFTGYSRFNIGLPVYKKGVVAVEKSTKQKYSQNPETVIFCIPDSHRKDMQYELFRAKNRFLLDDFSIIINANLSHNTDRIPGDYIVAVKSKNGQILLEKDISLKDGLNFIDLHVEKQNKEVEAPATKLAESPETTFEKATLYFDQSSYDLKTDSKLTLDTAASYLLNHRETKILVVGYTDNVGSREPNVTLSEYRARAGTGYLQKKGVSPNQIITKWEGPNQQIETTNTPNKGAKNRRVVLEIIK